MKKPCYKVKAIHPNSAHYRCSCLKEFIGHRVTIGKNFYTVGLDDLNDKAIAGWGVGIVSKVNQPGNCIFVRGIKLERC